MYRFQVIQRRIKSLQRHLTVEHEEDTLQQIQSACCGPVAPQLMRMPLYTDAHAHYMH